MNSEWPYCSGVSGGESILKSWRRTTGYGEQIVPTLAAQLVRDYGQSFTEKNLRRMVQFAATFPEEPIVVTLSTTIELVTLRRADTAKDRLQQDILRSDVLRGTLECVRSDGRIDSMLYQRTALSRRPDALICWRRNWQRVQDAQPMSPESRYQGDSHVLDFLGLRDSWQESDLEAAIIREMESFLLELGVGFTFVARQKRIQLDGDNFYLDLLFYNRKLRRLVAVN